ncbi:sulfurtransferase TusA family protein [Candidatus Acetothermia bacterium]|nr:sulfurtransferase TusA family protein [Candidatus Acetothermia bacterium]
MTRHHSSQKVLDLRGLKCPLTFVHLRLAFEEMNAGQLLRILIDDKLASVDVPKNAELEGHQVLSVKTLSDQLWEVCVRKAPFSDSPAS